MNPRTERNRTHPFRLPVLLVAALAAAAVPAAARASDHADPTFVAETRVEGGLTGLFFFPKGDHMILVLGVHPGLQTAPPFDLEPYEFRIHIDHHSEVSYDDPQDVTRYGGTVVNPEGIAADVVFQLRFDDQGTLSSARVHGLADPHSVQVYSGVRDDPFIFPRFFKRNIVAAVLAIPKSSFPAGRQDFVLWATTLEDGVQVDHVGRSNRSQNARSDFLNTIPVHQQMQALHDEGHRRDEHASFLNRCNFLGGAVYQLVHLVWQLRPYDLVSPDVMIYTSRRPPGYPNGRRLEDDIVLLTCQTGDCVLMELAYTEGNDWPRATTNDKDFLPQFPYLAEPWPAQEPAAQSGGLLSLCSLAWIVGILLVLFLLSYLFFAFSWWRLRKWKQQYPDVSVGTIAP